MAKMTMRREISTFKEAYTLVRQVWRNALAFFLSIELALMLLVVAATVAGLFFAVLQDIRSVFAFGFVIAYIATRIILHLKRKLHWPFI